MGRSARDNEKRRLREEEFERQRQAEAEELETKDRLDLDWNIENCNSMDDVRYILKRMARAQALQLQLIKGMVK